MLTKHRLYSYGELLVVLREVWLNFQRVKNVRKCTHRVTIWRVIFFVFFIFENRKTCGKEFVAYK